MKGGKRQRKPQTDPVSVLRDLMMSQEVMLLLLFNLRLRLDDITHIPSAER